ncbi:MAG: dephospho-CoA kinase [Candidatus Cloacimonetes bacterium]|nr:dephospho-CoA kinase [Candidatus Cloacimonadota bacterium]
MATGPILIGITGNIGSGKSSFSRLLAEQGYDVVFADEVAQLQLDDPQSLNQIVRRWGKEVVKDGRPDRQKIAAIVFGNKAELEFLNSVVHPMALTALQQIADSHQGRYLFFEVPLLFEAGMQHCFDYIVLVTANRKKRLQRLLKKGRETSAQIEARMDAQIEDLVKIPLCNLVIDNNGSLAALKASVKEFIDRLDSIRHKDKIPFS